MRPAAGFSGSRAAFLLTVLLGAAIGAAEEAPGCLSKYTRTDICAKARQMQEEMAPHLPTRISADVTIVNVLAVGPRLGLTAVWQMTKAELDQRLFANNMTRDGLADRMTAAATNSVCSDRVLTAFVGLGGQIQYNYLTTDGFRIASPAILACRRDDAAR